MNNVFAFRRRYCLAREELGTRGRASTCASRQGRCDVLSCIEIMERLREIAVVAYARMLSDLAVRLRAPPRAASACSSALEGGPRDASAASTTELPLVLHFVSARRRHGEPL